MDGLSGLEKVFKEEFSNSSVQRCQVHLARNVLSKVPIKHKKEVADDLRSIFYASSKDKAMDFFKDFKNKYDKNKVKMRLIYQVASQLLRWHA